MSVCINVKHKQFQTVHLATKMTFCSNNLSISHTKLNIHCTCFPFILLFFLDLCSHCVILINGSVSSNFDRDYFVRKNCLIFLDVFGIFRNIFPLNTKEFWGGCGQHIIHKICLKLLNMLWYIYYWLIKKRSYIQIIWLLRFFFIRSLYRAFHLIGVNMA